MNRARQRAKEKPSNCVKTNLCQHKTKKEKNVCAWAFLNDQRGAPSGSRTGYPRACHAAICWHLYILLVSSAALLSKNSKLCYSRSVASAEMPVVPCGCICLSPGLGSSIPVWSRNAFHRTDAVLVLLSSVVTLFLESSFVATHISSLIFSPTEM